MANPEKLFLESVAGSLHKVRSGQSVAIIGKSLPDRYRTNDAVGVLVDKLLAALDEAFVNVREEFVGFTVPGEGRFDVRVAMGCSPKRVRVMEVVIIE